MKYTTCENCLSDLEDYTWVYCDDCWQKLCADLKKARVTVDEKFIEKYAQEIFSDIYRPLFPLYSILERMLNEAGVNVANPDNNSVKVSGKKEK